MAWHKPEIVKISKVIKAIKKTQASGMRIIKGAYRATPIKKLETKIFMPPVNIYYAELRAKQIRAIYTSPVKMYIQEQYKAINYKLYRRNPQKAIPITAPVIQKKLNWVNKRETMLSFTGKRAINQEWKIRWRLKRKREWFNMAATEEPSEKRFKLYTQLKKAESSMLIQTRTRRIGLANFLNKARVPGVESLECRYERGIETAEHLLLHYFIKQERKGWRDIQLSELLSNAKHIETIAKWIIQSNKLGQFQFAGKLLYKAESSSAITLVKTRV